MEEEGNTSQLLKEIFVERWNDLFIFDAIGNGAFTYGDFFNSALNCKEKLEELGLEEGDIVCLMLPNSLDLLVLYFACLMKQITVVPIDPNKGENEIGEVLAQLRYKKIIWDQINDGFPKSVCIKTIREAFYEKRSANEEKLRVLDSINYNSLFLIAFTSGSTGVPRGVMHTFNNLFQSAMAFRKRFNFGKQNIFYHNLPMTYMAGILNLYILPLVSGSKIVIGERFNISNIMRFWDIPIKYSVNTFWFIPTIIALLLRLDRGKKGIEYAKVTKIVGCVGTAPLKIEAKKAFEDKYKIQLFESYGLSETLFVTTNFPKNEKDGSAGLVLDGVELSFNGDNEILINLPWMFLGYHDVSMEEFFDGGKFRSGDLGTIDEKGFLIISGRKKDLIKRGGMNVSPRRIEEFINAFDIFEESVILGIDDFNLGEKTVCFFVPNRNFNNKKKKELNRNIIKKLGEEYYIDEYIRIDSIPKNANGKIDKLKIIEMYEKSKNT